MIGSPHIKQGSVAPEGREEEGSGAPDSEMRRRAVDGQTIHSGRHRVGVLVASAHDWTCLLRHLHGFR